MRQLMFGLLLAVCAPFANAIGNAAPFGVELGVASLSDVQKQIGTQAKLNPTGKNLYSGGKMFVADGKALNVEGVRSVTFIFDTSDLLAGVIVSMSKDPKSLTKSFSEKYQVITNQIDGFLNYGYAKYQKGESFIEINAPHLSFEMEVRYLSKKLLLAFQQQSEAEASTKQKRKADSL